MTEDLRDAEYETKNSFFQFQSFSQFSVFAPSVPLLFFVVSKFITAC